MAENLINIRSHNEIADVSGKGIPAALFLYTDGLSETIDPDERMFGTERILEQLNKEPDASPEETLHSMKEAVVEYMKGKEPFDDMTMMSFVYHGSD